MIRKYTIADINKRLNHLFTVGDFYLDRTMRYIKLDEELVESITKICDHYGKKCKFPTKNSVYRTPESNRACGGAKHSKHLQGIAADFYIEGVKRNELAKYAEKLRKGRGGFGVYGGKSEHIHLDTRNDSLCWWIKTSGSFTPGFGGVPVRFMRCRRSPAIAEIQAALNAKGFNCGTPDGVYGAKTTAAVTMYQTSVNLEPDGVYGAETNKKLGVFDW